MQGKLLARSRSVCAAARLAASRTRSAGCTGQTPRPKAGARNCAATGRLGPREDPLAARFSGRHHRRLTRHLADTPACDSATLTGGPAFDHPAIGVTGQGTVRKASVLYPVLPTCSPLEHSSATSAQRSRSVVLTITEHTFSCVSWLQVSPKASEHDSWRGCIRGQSRRRVIAKLESVTATQSSAVRGTLIRHRGSHHREGA